MTTPDTLASLIAKMPHHHANVPMNEWDRGKIVFDETCDACRCKGAIDALARKWEKEAPEDYCEAIYLKCAAELRGKT